MSYEVALTISVHVRMLLAMRLQTLNHQVSIAMRVLSQGNRLGSRVHLIKRAQSRSTLRSLYILLSGHSTERTSREIEVYISVEALDLWDFYVCS